MILPNMKTLRWTFLACLLLSCLLLLQPAQAQQARAPDPDSMEAMPNFPGREDAFNLCSACHSMRVVGRQGMSRQRWDDTLTWMSEKHSMPPLEGAERISVLDYLEKAYPQTAPSAGGWRSPFAPK
jgi:hypothetical protein